MSSERDLERKVTEWLEDGPVTAPRAPLDAALEHAAAHTRRSSIGCRLRSLIDRLLHLAGLASTGGSLTAPERRGLVLSLARVAAVAVIVTLAGLVVLEGRLGRPGQSNPLQPDTSGLPGSLWLDDSSGIPVYYLVHPDGTLVTLGGNGSIGLGVWQPTGERSLASTLVVPDADPSPDVGLGTATYRAEWVVDADGEHATVTYAATFERADGAPVPEETGDLTLTRLHPATLPGDPDVATPPGPAWTVTLGPPLHGAGSAGIFLVPGDPPAYDVAYADGTALTISLSCGDTVGLWAPTGEGRKLRSDWSVTSRSADDPYVAESTLVGLAPAMTIEPLDPDRAVAESDPVSWPALGTIWVEPTAPGLAVRSVYLADGTVVSVHPAYGTGVGLWQPTGGDTFASTIHYQYGRTRLRSESTVSPDGETISTRYRVVDDWAGTPEEGSSTATRMHLEPLASTASPGP